MLGITKFVRGLSYTGALLAPVYVFAQAGGQTITGILTVVGNIINVIIPILVSLSVLYFVYGVGLYVVAKGPEDKDRAKGVIIYGILGIFVIFSIWGIVSLIGSSFGIAPETPAPDAPSIPGS